MNIPCYQCSHHPFQQPTQKTQRQDNGNKSPHVHFPLFLFLPMLIVLLLEKLEFKDPLFPILMDQFFVMGYPKPHHSDHRKGGEAEGQQGGQKSSRSYFLKYLPEETEEEISENSFDRKGEGIKSNHRDP